MQEVKKFHLIGVAGSGMSALAKCLIEAGNKVSGSDLKKPPVICELIKKGLKFFPYHSKENVPDDVDVVVISRAISEKNEEVKRARELGKEVIKLSKQVGRLMQNRYGIAIAGTHGKTTTTALTTYILYKAGLKPGFICGGVISHFKTNGAIGRNKYFVVEACEYERSFLDLTPSASIVTNIEEEHLDYYKDINDIKQAFTRFMENTKEFIVGCIDSPYVSSLLPSFRKKAETVSIKREADWFAKDIRIEGGLWRFSVLKYGKMYGEYTIKLPGVQNILNALCSIAIANYIGVGEEIIEVALSEFTGVERRCHVLGEKKGILVIDDYAHHPTQIKVTLEAIHERYPDRKIWCVFQPHQHSRTRLFLKEFSKSFQYADVVIVADIFQARDTPQDIKRISSRDLVNALDKIGKAALYLPSFEEILNLVSSKINSNAILVTMGAGDIYNIAHSFLFE